MRGTMDDLRTQTGFNDLVEIFVDLIENDKVVVRN